MKNILKKMFSVLAIFGFVVSFGGKALALTPAYVSASATNVTQSSATLQSTFNPKGLSTTTWFEMQNNQGVKLGTRNIGNGETEVSSSYNVSGLNAGTLYTFRSIAENETGTTFSGWKNFQTSSSSTGTCGSTCNPNPCTYNCNPNPCTYNCNPTPVYTPTVNLSANQTSVYSGSPVTLSWSSSNASYCSNNFGGSTSTSGSKVVYPTSTTTYTITCTGNGGSASDSTYVSVMSTPVYQTPTVNLSANQTSVYSGSPVTLSWSSSNASYCSNNFGGSTSTSGSKVVYPTSTTTYTITCTGNGGSASDTASIGVISNPIPVTPTVDLTAYNNSIAYNSATTLSWTSSNANSCYATNGWTGTKNTSGTQTTGNLTSSKTYTITCTGDGGSASDTVTVNVGNAPINNPTLDLSVNDNSVNEGDNVVLTWNVSNANSCTASNGWTGNKNANGGTQTIYLTSTKTFTMTCIGENGQSVSDSVTVTVTPNTVNQTPTVITVSPSGIGTTYAILNGTVSANGGSAVRAWFDWGTNTSMGNQTNQVNYGSASNTSYSYSLGGLQSNTTYYYRAVAQNNNGQIVYGSQMSFTTTGNSGCTYNCYNDQITVTTYQATDNFSNSAILNGYVNTNGNYTSRWFEYGTNSSNLFSQTSKTQSSTSGNYNQIVTGLQPFTTYYYRAVAQGNNGQMVYGNVLTFTTSGNGINNNTCNGFNCEPQAITTLATNIDANSARLNGLGIVNGNINSNGYFEYGETFGLGRVTDTRFIGSSSSSPYFASLFNLQPNTTYYYRAVVTNQYGTARGEIRTFRTRANSVVLGNNTVNTNTTTRIVYREVVPVTNVVTEATQRVGLSKSSLVFLTINRNNEAVGMGQTFDYTINYKNVSSENLKDLVLTVALPNELTFINSSRGNFSKEDHALVLTIDSLYPQEEGSVIVRVIADEQVQEGKIIVTTANMVYTVSNTNIQEEVFAYSKNTLETRNGQVLGAAVLGTSFFPNTLVGWLLLILIILLIILALRMAYYNNRNKTVINHNYTPKPTPNPYDHH